MPAGNTVLLRVLPAVYDMQPQPINNHLSELLALLAQLEQSEQYHLLRLLPQAAKKKQVEVSYMHWQRTSQRRGMASASHQPSWTLLVCPSGI